MRSSHGPASLDAAVSTIWRRMVPSGPIRVTTTLISSVCPVQRHFSRQTATMVACGRARLVTRCTGCRKAAQQHGANVDEISGEDGRGLPGQERPPGLPRPRQCVVDAGVIEDPPHRGWRDLVPKAGQLALDALVM